MNEEVCLCESTGHITLNSSTDKQDLITHHTHVQTHPDTQRSSCRCAAVGACDLLFCRLSGLLAAHPYCGCQRNACRLHPLVCRPFRSADWPLTEGNPEGGSPAVERHSGPPSSSAVP